MLMRRVLFLSLFLLPLATLAAPGDVRITEIMYDASGSDTGHEWVELWNGGTDSITIVGGSGTGSWRFYDGANHTFSAAPARGSATLAPGDFLVISSNTDTFLSDYPNFSGNLVKVSFSLGNTSETLFLRLETAGAPWGEVSYSNSQGGNGNGKTLEWNKNSNTWGESAQAGGTPGSFGNDGDTPVSLPDNIQGGPEVPAPPLEQNQNQQNQNPPLSYDLTADIRINEFLPDPTGSDTGEWIEIWNPMDRIADLTGWKIDDVEGGSNPFEFPVGSQLLPGSYTLLPRQQTGLQLNNDADSVRLIRPDGTIKDQVAYGEAPEGNSYAKDGIVWKWSSTPTPGEENKFSIAQVASEESQELPADGSKEEPATPKNQESGIRNKEPYVFEGVVTVEPGVFSTQYFYAQNKERGLQIYMYKKDFPELRRGSRVRVVGELGAAYGEDRLKVKTKEDIQFLGMAEELKAQETRIEDLTDEDVGKLILINGEAIDIFRGKAVLAHEGGNKELSVIWKSGAGEMPDIFPGDKVKVAGILRKSKNEYQLAPRDAEDLEIVEAYKKEEAAPALSQGRRPWFIYAAGVLGILLSSALIVYKRNKKIPHTG